MIKRNSPNKGTAQKSGAKRTPFRAPLSKKRPVRVPEAVAQENEQKSALQNVSATSENSKRFWLMPVWALAEKWKRSLRPVL